MFYVVANRKHEKPKAIQAKDRRTYNEGALIGNRTWS